MQDFIRIGGEIVSSPLNENFRRLLNQISISNTNLIFPEENAVVDTITEMKAIKEPDDAQTCYVVSSGELYRYSKAGNGEWLKIADFGQTFRQGFLNSGAVVLEDYITLKEGSTTILNMPAMLVYFKNQPGDERYLKGMYLIEAKQLDISSSISGANAYSIVVDVTGEYTLIPGMPKQDDPNHIYIGTILVNGDNEIIPHFVYTLPDIAYTADRGQFLLNGGQSIGNNLTPGGRSDGTVNKQGGYYYDEGINFTIGKTDDFPVDTDNGSNFNLKHYDSASPVIKLIYMCPEDSLNNSLTESETLICNKYWHEGKLQDVPEGQYTIQQHLITPNGQNIILYGDELYNSIMDAVANINTSYGLSVNFPYVQVTRIALGNFKDFSTDNSYQCRFFTMGRLSQVGTISPEFADNEFKIYSGESDDITPAMVRFDLGLLQQEEFNNLYNLTVLPYNTTRNYFALDKKYITNDILENVIVSGEEERETSGLPGYYIADNEDLLQLANRVRNIESEIWLTYNDQKERYEQSVRYRLFNAEVRLDAHDDVLEKHNERLVWLENTKVNKGTLINGYTLGDTANKEEIKSFSLQTGDINEGAGLTEKANLWYTEDRVSANKDVTNATKHINTKSASDSASGHTVVNPHNLSTDDIKLLSNTTKVFVTPDEERRIRSDKLPDDTIQALADLDAKNMDNIQISTIDGNTEVSNGTIKEFGKVTAIRFYEDGVTLNTTTDGSTLVVECKGQVDEDKVMLRNIYAQKELLEPELLAGYVDNAVISTTAYDIHGMTDAGSDKYYGTNEEGIPGIYDVHKFVTTTSADDYAEIDQIAYVPMDGSVQESHLANELANKINNNYHVIYNTGVLKSAEINTFNFGDNLTVDIDGHTATINASGEGGSGGVSNFANLNDVDVVYTGNAGKTLIINEDETGITYYDAPSLDAYMLKTVYMDTNDVTKVKKAVLADRAISADSATNASAVNAKTVDDTKTTNGVLWTAEKIISNTSSQIRNEGVNTYSGTTVPESSLGKNGDLYILIEG